jgi:hypothetical protein
VEQLGYARFQLSWRAQGSYQWFEIEAQEGDGPFQPVTDANGAPLAWYAPSIVLDVVDAPELQSLAFRVREVLGGALSGWSAVATARVGVLPVTDLTATPGIGPDGKAGPPITVRWTSPSAIDAEIAVERALDPFASGAFGAWSPIAAGRDAAIDVPPTDGATYRYRVRRGREGLWSSWVETGTYYPVLAPIDVRVEAVVNGDGTATGFRITWRNRSVVADGIAILRTSQWTGPIATLPADATSYVDHFPAWSSWRYQVEATVGATSWLGAQSDVAEPPPFLIPGGPPVEAGSVELPCDDTMLRDGDGRWLCRLAFASQPTLLWMDPTGAWEQRTFSSTGAPRLLLDFDGGGAPHALVTHAIEPGTQHLWHDGAAWQEEEVPLPGLDPTQLWNTWPRVVGFGVTAAGAPVVLLQRGYQFSETYGVLTRTETGWSERPIHIRPEFFWFDLGAFAVAPDGTAVVFGGAAIQGVAMQCAMARMAPDDPDALVETIPGTDGACLDVYYGMLLGAGTERTAIAYALRRDTGEFDWFYREHGADGWRDPELVVTQPASRRVIVPHGTLSRGGARAALFLSWPNYWYADPQTYKAFARGPRGGWREFTLGPGFPGSGRVRGAGFLGDGRLWIVGDDEMPFYGPRRYGFYEEL